ncbi:MAG: hypothetical protein WAK17_24835 [Candidatus Nitrosopolaris sp.]
MSRNQIIFTDDKDTIDFARKFLNQRISSLGNDVKRCLTEDRSFEYLIGQPAPYPALLYSFSIIDLLASLSAGSTDNAPGEKTKRAKKYMVDFMGYKDHIINLLQELFRHKLVHLSEPAYSFLYNGKRIAWIHDERPTAKHLDVQDLNKYYDIFGKRIWHDRVFIIKVSQFKDDIVKSVTDSKNGLLTKIEIDKHMRENFKTAIREIFH